MEYKTYSIGCVEINIDIVSQQINEYENRYNTQLPIAPLISHY